jgi:inorganic pyrophosphatase
MNADSFWHKLDQLVAEHELVIDRPKGSRHPRYPEMVYPLDYGYLEGTQAADGDGIDVWVGGLLKRAVTAVVCTVDMLKRDAEIKILLGCTSHDMQTILDFYNDDSDWQSAILIERSQETRLHDETTGFRDHDRRRLPRPVG